MSEFEITSGEIIFECLREHGKGELFLRCDGLQFEEERAQLRRDYLESHPEIKESHRRAILEAAVTPGMTKPQVTAAWGLLEEDTRTAFAHVTDDGRAAYAYVTGFSVGESYAVYFKDDVVVGVRQTAELVPPHKHEVTMRDAEETRRLFYFSDGDEDELWGSEHHFAGNWDPTLLRRANPRQVFPLSAEEIQQHLRAKGLFAEYELAVRRLGHDYKTASYEVASLAALSVLPYLGRTTAQERSVNSLDDSSLVFGDQSPTSQLIPPEEWFWQVANSGRTQARFPSSDDKSELVSVQWYKGGTFVVNQVPLLVNGVSQFDIVECEWENDDPIPHFKRVVRNIGYRTVRVVLTDAKHLGELAKFATDCVDERYLGRYRLENDILAFTIPESELYEEFRWRLNFISATWLHTDTLSQD
jgi:hypothetical protein